MEAQGVLRGGKRVFGVRYLGCCTVPVNRGRCVAVFGWCPLREVMSPCQFPALLCPGRIVALLLLLGDALAIVLPIIMLAVPMLGDLQWIGELGTVVAGGC